MDPLSRSRPSQKKDPTSNTSIMAMLNQRRLLERQELQKLPNILSRQRTTRNKDSGPHSWSTAAFGGFALTVLSVGFALLYSKAWIATTQDDLVLLLETQASEAPSRPVGPEGRKKRLAVVVAGSFLRFSLTSFLDNVVPSVVQQGHSLDYFVSLTIENAPAYRADAGYMNYLTWDPIFGETMPSSDQIKSTLLTQFSNYTKASVNHVEIQPSVDINVIPEVVSKRRNAKQDHPNDEDLDLRFPMLDLRAKARSRTANANRNMLRLFWNQQQLWRKLVAFEKKEGITYDYVMVMRDDTEWLETFDFDLLLDQNRDAYVYIPSCDARNPPLHPLDWRSTITLYWRNALPQTFSVITFLFCFDQI